jgi:hypothetical protein
MTDFKAELISTAPLIPDERDRQLKITRENQARRYALAHELVTTDPDQNALANAEQVAAEEAVQQIKLEQQIELGRAEEIAVTEAHDQVNHELEQVESDVATEIANDQARLTSAEGKAVEEAIAAVPDLPDDPTSQR